MSPSTQDLLKQLIRETIRETLSEQIDPVDVLNIQNEVDGLVHRIEMLRQQSTTEWDFEMLSKALESLSDASRSLKKHSGSGDVDEGYVGFIANR